MDTALLKHIEPRHVRISRPYAPQALMRLKQLKNLTSTGQIDQDFQWQS
jgi:hypothetical protein